MPRPPTAWQPLYEEDSQGGSSPKPNKAERVAELATLDATKLAVKIADLEADNYKYRQRIDAIERERDTYKRERDDLQQRLPAQGSVVLSGDDAQRWQAYTALGTPDELKQGLQQRDADAKELATLRRTTLVRDVADTYGYRATVLDRLLGDEALERREVKDGETTKPIYVVKRESGETPLDTYVTEQYADFLPALQRDTATQQQTQTPRPGARVIEQHHGGSGQPTSLVDDFVKESQTARASRPNPLIKQPAT